MSTDVMETAPLASLEHDPPSAKDTQRKPAATETPAQSFSDTAQQFTDRALEFLSTASNETLGACLVGLGATTYFVLGRVGLVLIGVVGGVVLHATWEDNSHGGRSQTAKAAEEKRRREVGLDVIHRVLSWRTRAGKVGKADGDSDDDDEATSNKIELASRKKLDFSDFRPETAKALNEFTDAFTRDYVKWWYDPILPGEQTFPIASQRMMVGFLTSIANHMYRKRPADTFLNFLTNSSSILIVFLNELSTAMAASPNTSATEAVQTYLKLKPESSLANVLDTKHQQKKLDLVAQDILECYLDSKALNCEPVQAFTKQILSKVMMEMTITSCSKPEFINGWIVYLLEDGEPELMKDIDAGLQGVEDSKSMTAANSAVEAIASPPGSPITAEASKHKRTISRAQEAMDEAMQEAQRLTQLMIEDDARREREQQDKIASAQSAIPSAESKHSIKSASSEIESPSTASLTDDAYASESTTQGVATPTSSQSDAHIDDVESSVESRSATATQDQPMIATKMPFTSFDQLPPQQLTTVFNNYYAI